MTITYAQPDPPFVHVTGALWVGVLFIEHQGYSSSSFMTVRSLDGSTISISYKECEGFNDGTCSIDTTSECDANPCDSQRLCQHQVHPYVTVKKDTPKAGPPHARIIHLLKS